MTASATPTDMVARAARKGLDLRRKFKRGGTMIGVARARDLSNRREIPLATLRRISSYFSRHEIDKRGKNWGDDENPSAGYIAWLLWGGEPGKAWAHRALSQMEKASAAKQKTKRADKRAAASARGQVGAGRSGAAKRRKSTR